MSRTSPLFTKRARGAAMVEAAVVLPLLVSFLGVAVMMHRAYDTKLEQNHRVRSVALDYASHDCQASALSSADGVRTAREEVHVPAPGRIEGGREATALQEATSQRPETSGSSGFAEASYADQKIGSPFGKGRAGAGPSLTVHGASSLTLCNDPPASGGLVSLAKTIGGEIEKAAGGSADRQDRGRHDDFRTKDD